MGKNIQLSPQLAKELESFASVEKLSLQEFAVKVLADEVARRAAPWEPWAEKNQRRVDLIRKSNRGQLSPNEKQELRDLQAELDQRLQHLDQQMLGELKRMEEAVAQLPRDE